MPTYDFLCSKCNEVFEVRCTISEKDDQECGKCGSKEYTHYYSSTPAIGDSVRLGVRKNDDGFREVLSKIGQNNYRSNLSDKLSRK